MGLGFHFRKTKTAAANNRIATKFVDWDSRKNRLPPYRKCKIAIPADQSRRRWPAATGQYSLDEGQFFVFEINPCQNRNNDDRRIIYQGVATTAPGKRQFDADKCGRIDGNRAWRHLRNGDEIGELGKRQPLMQIHDLVFNKRNGRHAAADTKNTNLEKAPKKFDKSHRDSPAFRSFFT